MSRFDKLTNRRNTFSVKWDVLENELPMWVADMDFEVCEEIVNGMKERLNHPIFGYNNVPDEWYNAYISWWKKRHNVDIKKDWLMFSTGVVSTISSVVRRITRPGEHILLLTPVYNVFYNSIINNGRIVEECDLIKDNNNFYIDFTLLEEKLKNPLTTMMILCNPHNPIGRIWTKEELKKIGELCDKYHVVVLSDEIHCDITSINKQYIPYINASDICKNNCIVCISPTKTFNLAGIQTSAVYVCNEELRFQVFRAINNDEVAEPNTFAVVAPIYAYKYGEYWVDELRQYLDNNKLIVKKYIQEHIPSLSFELTDATYLIWIDISNITNDSSAFCKHLRTTTGLYISEGIKYGKVGNSFVRINIACPKERLLDGLSRLEEGVKTFRS